jgi:DNA-binding CsgD family transcriptional regulator
MHEHQGTTATPLSVLERVAIEELDQTPATLSRLERLLIAAVVEMGRMGAASRAALTVPPIPGLTAREREVLELIAAGHTNKSAAQVLNISARTVEIHRLRVQRKLGVRSAAELVRLVTEARPAIAAAASGIRPS